MIATEPPSTTTRLLLAAFLGPLVVLVFLPIDIYSANRQSMAFPVFTHLLFSLPAAAIAGGILFLALRLSPPRIAHVASALLLAAGITAWILAMFVQEGGFVLMGHQLLTPPVDSPPSKSYYAAAVTSLAVFAGLALGRPAVALRLGGALAALLTALSAYSIVTDTKPMPDVLGASEVSRFSETQPNVVVLLLDALQNDLAKSVLESDAALAADLEGFVFHVDAMSVAPSTFGSIPAIHSGVTLQGISSITGAYKHGVRESSFLVDLAAKGYVTSVINPLQGVCPENSAFCSWAAVTVDGFFPSTVSQALYLVDLALFRIAPRELRYELYDGGRWLLTRLTSPGGYPEHAAATIRQITKDARLDSIAPTAKLLHLFIAHPPFSVDQNCRGIGQQLYTPEGALDAAHCALRHVARVTRDLRSKGIFDNTLLIVVSDHGLGIVKDDKGRLSYEWADPFARMVALASATLAVKPFNSRGPLSFSREPVSIADVKKIVCEQTGACDTVPATNRARGGSATPARRFSYYVWEHQFSLLDEVPSVQHFTIRGDYRLPWSWMPVVDPDTFDIDRITFSDKDPAAVYGPGWGAYQGAGEHTWRCVMGQTGQVYVNLPGEGSPKVSVYIKNHPLNTNQVAEVRMNGTPIHSFQPSAEGAQHTFPIPAHMQGRTPAVLTFSFSEANAAPGSPTAVAGCFFSLTVKPER